MKSRFACGSVAILYKKYTALRGVRSETLWSSGAIVSMLDRSLPSMLAASEADIFNELTSTLS